MQDILRSVLCSKALRTSRLPCSILVAVVGSIRSTSARILAVKYGNTSTSLPPSWPCARGAYWSAHAASTSQHHLAGTTRDHPRLSRPCCPSIPFPFRSDMSLHVQERRRSQWVCLAQNPPTREYMTAESTRTLNPCSCSVTNYQGELRGCDPHGG